MRACQEKPWAPRSEAQDNGKENGKQQANVFNAQGLNQMTFDPIKYVIHGYIVEGLTLFAGKPKIGKSWLLLHAAFAVAEGGYTLGNVQCNKATCSIAALEDNQRRLQSRHDQTVRHAGLAGQAALHLRNAAVGRRRPRLHQDWIESVKQPRLVIIDTLAMVRTPNRKDTSTYDADYAAVKELRDLALECGIAIVLVHHLRKAEADDPFDTISGTLGLTGAPDTIMILSRDQSRGTRLHAKGATWSRSRRRSGSTPEPAHGSSWARLMQSKSQPSAPPSSRHLRKPAPSSHPIRSPPPAA